MRPKGMEDSAAFSVREVKRSAAEERERDEYFKEAVCCPSAVVQGAAWQKNEGECPG